MYCFDDKKSIEQKTVKKHDGLVQVELFDSDNASDDIILVLHQFIDDLLDAVKYDVVRGVVRVEQFHLDHTSG